MFEPAFMQFIELSAVESALAQLRADRLKVAVTGATSTTGEDDLAAATDRVVAEVLARYRSPVWKAAVPPLVDPDPTAQAGLTAARENALQTVLLMHRLVCETPIVGCDDERVGPTPGE
jgi:hypothetical protein